MASKLTELTVAGHNLTRLPTDRLASLAKVVASLSADGTFFT
jgi:hypothetical protein